MAAMLVAWSVGFGVAASNAGAAEQGEPCTMLAGDNTQGGLLFGRVAPGSRVSVAGQVIPVLDDGRIMIGLGRDAPPETLLSINDADAKEGAGVCEQVIAAKQREYRIQRVDGVPQRTVTPPPEQLERIARERALVRNAKAQRYERPEWYTAVANGMQWPVTGRISGVYGSQRVYNGTPGSPHYGIDIAIPTGTPVAAPAPGKVTLAEDDLFYSGGTVILDHGYGLSSSFLHLSRIDVAVGDELSAGDVLGLVGASGRATGPHLDWRMSWLNERVDPQLLVPPMPGR